VNGLTDLAVTKLDVLDTFDRIGICTGYRIAGELVLEFPGDIAALEGIEPVYEWHEGWKRSTADARRMEDLPDAARAYLHRIETLVETPVMFVSVGTRRDQIIDRQEEEDSPVAVGGTT
jgi:adenylosuccinate synthase